MDDNRQQESVQGFFAESRELVRRGRQVWRLLLRRHRVALAVAALAMALVSGCNTAIPLLLGELFNSVKAGIDQGLSAMQVYGIAAIFLGIIGAAVLLREGLQLVRRYMVEKTCTGIASDMTVRVLACLIKADLSAVTADKLGALQSRISRSVQGYVRFIRLGFLDFFPPLLTGLFAI